MKRKRPPQDAGFHEEWDEDDDSEDLLVEGRGYVTDGVSTVTTCNVQGCNQVTNHLKPVCQEHILNMQAAKEIRAELAYREKEAKWAGSKRNRWRVDPYGTRATDLKLIIDSKGVITLAKLAMESDLPKTVLRGYLERMQDAGLVRLNVLRTLRKLAIGVVSIDRPTADESADE